METGRSRIASPFSRTSSPNRALLSHSLSRRSWKACLVSHDSGACTSHRGQFGEPCPQAPRCASEIPKISNCLELTSAQLMWALSLNYALAVWAIKLSILLLYVRLFRVDSKSFRFLIYFGIFATSALSFSAAVSLVLICQPLSYFWNQFDGVSSGYCRLNINHLYLAIAVINLCLDLYLLVLPIPRVMRLQMSPRRKLVVCASLFLGIM